MSAGYFGALVFELKMFIGNLRDFALMPVSLGAALIDLVSKGEREGSLFYRVLRWGAHSEEVLDAYSPIKHELQDRTVNPNYTVDAVVARLEACWCESTKKAERLQRLKQLSIAQSISFIAKRGRTASARETWW
jgi:hypothetical protein